MSIHNDETNAGQATPEGGDPFAGLQEQIQAMMDSANGAAEPPTSVQEKLSGLSETLDELRVAVRRFAAAAEEAAAREAAAEAAEKNGEAEPPADDSEPNP